MQDRLPLGNPAAAVRRISRLNFLHANQIKNNKKGFLEVALLIQDGFEANEGLIYYLKPINK
jgi:hypothetical protein